MSNLTGMIRRHWGVMGKCLFAITEGEAMWIFRLQVLLFLE